MAECFRVLLLSSLVNVSEPLFNLIMQVVDTLNVTIFCRNLIISMVKCGLNTVVSSVRLVLNFLEANSQIEIVCLLLLENLLEGVLFG